LDCYKFCVSVAEISADSSRQQDVRPESCHLFVTNVTQPASQPASVRSSQPLDMKLKLKLSAAANAITEEPGTSSSNDTGELVNFS